MAVNEAYNFINDIEKEENRMGQGPGISTKYAKRVFVVLALVVIAIIVAAVSR